MAADSDVNGCRMIRTPLEDDFEKLMLDKFCNIADNLYLGSYQSVRILQDNHDKQTSSRGLDQTGDIERSPTSGQELSLSGSAVLTVDSRKLPKDITDLCADYFYLKAEDSLQNELIRHFDECFDFIEKHRVSGNKVLVHCNAGMSRSASVMAAYLMKKEGIPFSDALARIRQFRPIAMPNSSFLEQLRIYQKMGNKVDPLHPVYRHFRLGLLTQTVVPEKEIDSYLGSLPSDVMEISEVYYCRMCRCKLFSTSNMLTHPAKAMADLSNSDSSADLIMAPEASLCSRGEIFIEPVVWMKEEIAKLEGKLTCYKCSKKVGTFSWIGERCPCGVFVTPSFHMDKGKVELRKQLKF